MKSYFTDRNQSTKIENIISSNQPMTLGCPQGSVMACLLFLIFINDLDSRLESITKLFADDTTCLSTGEDIDSTIIKLKQVMKQLSEWCKHNRLYINWDKTFILFITNKRFKIPESILIDSITIKVVDRFKLLGVTIDRKLTFRDHVSQQCNAINRKLFAIKRMFYLSNEVRLQFFKTFILPYFDYGIGLSIYFHKDAMKKLCKTYYLCLFKLFKLKANEDLSLYGLQSFNSRISTRILQQINNLQTAYNAPEELKSWINQFKSPKTTLDLRSHKQATLITTRSSNKFGDLTFNFLISNLINKLKLNSAINFSDSKKNFSKFIFSNQDFLTKLFIEQFKDKYIFNFDYYFYKKNTFVKKKKY